MNKIKSLYINSLFFYILLGVAGLFFVSFFAKWLFIIAFIALIILVLLTFTDIFILYSRKNGIAAKRELPEKLSNSDENPIKILLQNQYPIPVKLQVVDEIPFQFQMRDFNLNVNLPSFESKIHTYTLRPTERGEYSFGKMNVYARTPLGLVAKRYVTSENAMVPVYPSFIQLKKYDLMAFSHHFMEYGLKKIRRVGHTMEFEHIRDYVQGDDLRTINWKATSKKHSLMVNQYQDEKSQPVYQIIDIGRVMQMPFAELSLLDYAINATLALSNIVLKKHDKAGMFTFSKMVENIIPAERRSGQMQRILETLYRIETDFYESDFSRLYVEMKQNIRQRSLVMLYTNFETLDALRRQLPYLKGIAKNHLLIVIFFDNTELNQIIHRKARNTQEIYDKVIAEKFAFEKRLIVQELLSHGIQSILTPPENLTISAINKYLELKARGMI